MFSNLSMSWNNLDCWYCNFCIVQLLNSWLVKLILKKDINLLLPKLAMYWLHYAIWSGILRFWCWGLCDATANKSFIDLVLSTIWCPFTTSDKSVWVIGRSSCCVGCVSLALLLIQIHLRLNSIIPTFNSIYSVEIATFRNFTWTFM